MTLSEIWAAAHPKTEAELTEQIRVLAGQIEELSASLRLSWTKATRANHKGDNGARAIFLDQWLKLTEEQNDVQAHMNRLALMLCQAKVDMLVKQVEVAA